MSTVSATRRLSAACVTAANKTGDKDMKGCCVSVASLAKDATLTQQPFISLSPVLLAAVTQAADNRRVAETVLITNWLLQTGPLETINPEDQAKVVAALLSIGQEDVAKALTKEILRAHLLNRFAAGIVDGTAS